MTQFSLKSVESLQNVLQLHSGATPLAYIVLNEANINHNELCKLQGPVYIERQRQCCDDASDTSLIEYNGVARERVCNHSGATPLYSMTEVPLASSLRRR